MILVVTLVLDLDYNFPMTTDPRDRILSLLHLARDTAEYHGFPDYSLTCEQVYEMTAEVMLLQGHVDMLLYVHYPKVLSRLPSWVPDWSMRLRDPIVCRPWFSRFRASGDAAVRTYDDDGPQENSSISSHSQSYCNIPGSLYEPDGTLCGHLGP
jgi:hypothetical protein